jgi:hypothetical protein
MSDEQIEYKYIPKLVKLINSDTLVSKIACDERGRPITDSNGFLILKDTFCFKTREVLLNGHVEEVVTVDPWMPLQRNRVTRVPQVNALAVVPLEKFFLSQYTHLVKQSLKIKKQKRQTVEEQQQQIEAMTDALMNMSEEDQESLRFIPMNNDDDSIEIPALSKAKPKAKAKRKKKPTEMPDIPKHINPIDLLAGIQGDNTQRLSDDKSIHDLNK